MAIFKTFPPPVIWHQISGENCQYDPSTNSELLGKYSSSALNIYVYISLDKKTTTNKSKILAGKFGWFDTEWPFWIYRCEHTTRSSYT